MIITYFNKFAYLDSFKSLVTNFFKGGPSF